MKSNEEFDRLIRQKLNNRDFAFDEAHWSQAQAMIHHHRKKRPGYFWLFLILIPFAGLVIWLNGKDSAPAPAHRAMQSSPMTIQEKYSDRGVPEDHSFSSSNTHGETTAEKVSTHNDITSDQESAISARSSDHTKRSVIDPSIGNGGGFNSSDILPAAFPDHANNREHGPEKKTVLLRQNQDSRALHGLGEAGPVENTGGISVDQAEASIEVSRILSRPGTIRFEEGDLRTAPPMTYPVEKRWKLSLFGGLWVNNTDIQSAEGSPWLGEVRSMTTPSAGFEVMRDYRHFGWGSGLQYMSYGEEGLISADSAQQLQNYSYWVLQPVDTSLWIITDSVANGNGYTYLGYSQDQTVMVLEQATGSRLELTETRPARQVRNRLSYLEIPLLADVHISSGPWTFGLRGGPGISRIITRTGYVPVAESTGYQVLDERIARQWIPSYQIRIYGEYALSSRWAAGLQFGHRGLIGNSLRGEQLFRRTSAWGGMFHLSYSFITR